MENGWLETDVLKMRIVFTIHENSTGLCKSSYTLFAELAHQCIMAVPNHVYIILRSHMQKIALNRLFHTFL